jgi:hypothetical protein
MAYARRHPSLMETRPVTLVIGYADNDIGFMVGDTLLSHEHFRLKDDVGPVNGEFHSLKIQILSGSIAVAFAGKFEEAYQAIRNLKAVLSAHPDIDPVGWLAQRDGLNGCEFLVLLNRDRKQLFRISDGTVSEFKTTYVGVQDDYRKYLELRKPYTGPATRLVIDGGANTEIPVTEGEKEFDVVSDAMEALSRDTVGRKHVTVGAISGCVIRVVDARLSEELEYMQSVEVSNFPWGPRADLLCSQRTPTIEVLVYILRPATAASCCLPVAKAHASRAKLPTWLPFSRRLRTSAG